ncbi:polymorphic toxin type 44 domain-containing protein [Pseudomonas kitaguniensis]|uniref:polymorphic toxin type 44 domain-containing protein n=1 Tax=Pseudomonas kitaguniensis TaxID=2607908 RepID=UPI003CFC6E43
MTKDSTADGKLSQSRSLFSGQDALRIKNTNAGIFVQAGLMSVRVDQPGLVKWANSYESARLSQVYAESARRLRAKENALKLVETAKASHAAAELQAAREQVKLKRYPAAPPGISLDENLQDAKLQSDYFNNGGDAFLLSWFYKKVRNGGDFDFKQRGRQYASFGNLNYGAVGAAAGISEAVLLRAAGAAQTVAGTSQEHFDNWWSEAPYGDDPVDQVWIKAGIEYAKSKGY